MWRTDDAGLTWKPPVSPSCDGCMHARLDGRVFDKPAIAVSYHNPTWAYVYLAVPLLDAFGSQTTTFYVFRSTDAGQTFYLTGTITGDAPGSTSPQIVVDNSNGSLYLFFLTWGSNTMAVYRSTDMGVNWTRLSTLATPELFTPTNNQLCSTSGGACLTAVSMLTARFNPSSRTVGVALHGRVSGRASPTFTH